MYSEKSLSEERIISLYRYLSFLITSLLYFGLNINHSIYRKFLIIVLLMILTITLNYLYTNNRQSDYKLKLLIVIESVGNAIILIPGGGLSSPYIWYSLNTILIASINLKKRYAWFNLGFYLVTASSITTYFQGTPDSIKELSVHSNIFLGLAFATAMTQILAAVNKDLILQKEKLLGANLRLIKANKESKDHLFFIMNIYECVDVLTSQQDEYNLSRMIVDYTKIITGSDEVSFLRNHHQNRSNFAVGKAYFPSTDEKFIPYIDMHSGEFKDNDIFVEKTGAGMLCIISLVKSDHKIYGILCAQLKYYKTADIEDEILNKIRFLSKVSAMGFDQIEMGVLNEKLIADKERNRIADEIHDGVLQKLFGLSCYLFNVSKKIAENDQKIIESELKKLRISLDVIITELRETIYGMSDCKMGCDCFTQDINKLIHETRQLNNIEINYHSSGDFGLLSTSQKKAFYRIICEGLSNSLRHGNADKIDMEFSVFDGRIDLEIRDNGIGFDYEGSTEEMMGLGIRNMKHLIYSLNGSLEIKSRPGDGTSIIATVSNRAQCAS